MVVMTHAQEDPEQGHLVCEHSHHSSTVTNSRSLFLPFQLKEADITAFAWVKQRIGEAEVL